MNKVKTRGWLGQPSIIKSLEQKFGKRAMKERLSLTLGTPTFTARRLENLEARYALRNMRLTEGSGNTAVFNQTQ